MAYGSTARIAMDAVDEARQNGIPVALIRPITLWPIPSRGFEPFIGKLKSVLVVEMSNGQLVEDVQLALRCSAPVEFFGHGGSWMPSTSGIREEIQKEGRGFALVEILAPCPSGWHMTPVEAHEWIESTMVKQFPLRVFRS